MLASAGLVLFIVAAILRLVDKHPDWILWLIIIGGILVCAEVAWDWSRTYRRGT